MLNYSHNLTNVKSIHIKLAVTHWKKKKAKAFTHKNQMF